MALTKRQKHWIEGGVAATGVAALLLWLAGRAKGASTMTVTLAPNGCSGASGCSGCYLFLVEITGGTPNGQFDLTGNWTLPGTGGPQSMPTYVLDPVTKRVVTQFNGVGNVIGWYSNDAATPGPVPQGTLVTVAVHDHNTGGSSVGEYYVPQANCS